MKPTSASSSFSSAASTPCSPLTELKRVRALLWVRLWLKGMLWMVWSPIQTTKPFSFSAVSLFYFLIIHVVTWSRTCNFLQCTFPLHSLLDNWCMTPSFWPVSAFHMPSSLSLIIPSFWFKVRVMCLFLSLGHLEATVALWIGLIFNVGVSHNREAWGEGERWGNSQWVEQSEHTYLSVKFTLWMWFMAPRNNYNSNIKDQWWQITITIIMKKLEMLELPKCDTDINWANTARKWHW